jgi:SAM-dependent methyltransferase
MQASESARCPACAQPAAEPFVEVEGLPVHVGVLWRTAADAVAAPRGPLRMVLCVRCGYVWNTAFDPGLLDYEQDYDNALHGSALFRRFEAATVEHLVERYQLRGRTVAEVGCGDGRFLGLLCAAGAARAVGFEPGYRPERRSPEASDQVEILAVPYSADHPDRGADLVAVRQVLEHMADPVGFLRTLRAGIGDRDTALYVDVPNGARITDDLAFWDLMYEHCGSYVTPALRQVAAAAGFAVTAVRPAHAGQFLVLEARPAGVGAPPDRAEVADEVASHVDRAARFGAAFERRVAQWREQLADHARHGATVVAWGAGGRAVNFFNTVGIGPEVAAVVDLNPAKQHTYLAGTGHEIVPPDRLTEDLRPDVVIVVNGVYADEVRTDLGARGLVPKIEVA